MEKLTVGIPTGVVLPFAGANAPDGFMLCDGRSLSRAAYAGLFSVIGTAHGAPDGNTFNIPDYRGRFLRGVDGTAGIDPDKAARTAMNSGGATGNAVGSVQGHAFQTHTHIQNSHTHNQVTKGGTGNINRIPTGGNDTGPDGTWISGAATATNQNAGATGSHSQASTSETRPVNVYVNYIIKV